MNKVKTIRDTSADVVRQMLEFCPILFSDRRILEPSAGKGDLLDHVVSLVETKIGVGNFKKNHEIDCVELNKERQDILKLKGYNVIGEDFFKMNHFEHKSYDYIIATPTYKDNIDVEHIMHMYEFLRRHSDSRIVTLTHPAWTTQNSERQQIFRKWLENKDYSMKMLNDFSYMEKYNTQPSVVITINYTHPEDE